MLFAVDDVNALREWHLGIVNTTALNIIDYGIGSVDRNLTDGVGCSQLALCKATTVVVGCSCDDSKACLLEGDETCVADGSHVSVAALPCYVLVRCVRWFDGSLQLEGLLFGQFDGIFSVVERDRCHVDWLYGDFACGLEVGSVVGSGSNGCLACLDGCNESVAVYLCDSSVGTCPCDGTVLGSRREYGSSELECAANLDFSRCLAERDALGNSRIYCY